MGISDLHQIKPIVIAGYVEQMEAYASLPTIKQHRSAISKMFDWLVAGNVGSRQHRGEVAGRATEVESTEHRQTKLPAGQRRPEGIHGPGRG